MQCYTVYSSNLHSHIVPIQAWSILGFVCFFFFMSIMKQIILFFREVFILKCTGGAGSAHTRLPLLTTRKLKHFKGVSLGFNEKMLHAWVKILKRYSTIQLHKALASLLVSSSEHMVACTAESSYDSDISLGHRPCSSVGGDLDWITDWSMLLIWEKTKKRKKRCLAVWQKKLKNM